jgi:hypothetical protein
MHQHDLLRVPSVGPELRMVRRGRLQGMPARSLAHSFFFFLSVVSLASASLAQQVRPLVLHRVRVRGFGISVQVRPTCRGRRL